MLNLCYLSITSRRTVLWTGLLFLICSVLICHVFELLSLISLNLFLKYVSIHVCCVLKSLSSYKAIKWCFEAGKPLSVLFLVLIDNCSLLLLMIILNLNIITPSIFVYFPLMIVFSIHICSQYSLIILVAFINDSF